MNFGITPDRQLKKESKQQQQQPPQHRRPKPKTGDIDFLFYALGY